MNAVKKSMLLWTLVVASSSPLLHVFSANAPHTIHIWDTRHFRTENQDLQEPFHYIKLDEAKKQWFYGICNTAKRHVDVLSDAKLSTLFIPFPTPLFFSSKASLTIYVNTLYDSAVIRASLQTFSMLLRRDIGKEITVILNVFPFGPVSGKEENKDIYGIFIIQNQIVHPKLTLPNPFPVMGAHNLIVEHFAHFYQITVLQILMQNERLYIIVQLHDNAKEEENFIEFQEHLVQELQFLPQFRIK